MDANAAYMLEISNSAADQSTLRFYEEKLEEYGKEWVGEMKAMSDEIWRRSNSGNYSPTYWFTRLTDYINNVLIKVR